MNTKIMYKELEVEGDKLIVEIFKPEQLVTGDFLFSVKGENYEFSLRLSYEDDIDLAIEGAKINYLIVTGAKKKHEQYLIDKGFKIKNT